MIAEPHPTEKEITPTRGVGRTLLPVLLNIALLGVMIGVGIERNRQRVQSNRGRLDDAISTLGEYCDVAVQFLVSEQAADGSWSYHRSRSPSFESDESAARAASTIRILLNVRGTGYEDEPFYAAGLDYVRKNPQPTVEVSSLRWFLLGREQQSADELRDFLKAQTMFSDKPPDSSSSLLKSDHLLLLGVLPALGMETSSIEVGIRRTLDSEELTPSTRILTAYLASLGAETGSSSSRSLVDRLLEEFRSEAGPNPWEKLDNLSLAAYVKLQADQCLLEPDPCVVLNAAVGTLVARRRADGSWEPGAFSSDGQVATGSAAETTSLALKGLTGFRQILENRAHLQGR